MGTWAADGRVNRRGRLQQIRKAEGCITSKLNVFKLPQAI